MNFLISTFIGVLCALALFRPSARYASCGLGWVVLVGVLAANFPHADNLLFFFGEEWRLAYGNGLTWSFLLAPFYAGALAWVVSVVARRPFVPFAAVAFLSLYSTIVLGLFTSRDIMVFAPFSNARFSVDLLYHWNATAFIVCVLFVAIALVFRQWRHVVARAGLAVLIGYVITIASFTSKATDFAEHYAKAFELDVAEVHLLPHAHCDTGWLKTVDG